MTQNVVLGFYSSSHSHEIFDLIKEDFVWHKSEINSIIKRDGVMIKNGTRESIRKDFFDDLSSRPLTKVENKYLDTSLKRQIIASIKPLLFSIAVFSLYMNTKEKVYICKVKKSI